ncbi:DNA polymerase III subunit gamma and tau [Agromyces sp. SYSU K20354]|uniref:DNA polymerase III subunit gamma and tau n=1 Tax=Agromyces cavernae TaxID=2898659 RepID=UPI001E562502|nr:DNA polymerase III subunit gamma and tau [Agromyces cavernae]MCD2442891.1 DNA polymerase III subunit gamma and tau [Agromyces cavernae]
MVTALYRRYRPETFAEMIGQSQVTEPLMTALRTDRVNHAYLFSGPRGCGKTTSARILARCLNCVEGPTDAPCGVCPSCVELSRGGGGALDVVEIDAASHGGVDDARDLRERAIFAPARDRFKIFIIDEAHMVTSGGFNALLKIVEEPPEHVKFIFATTEPDKVLGTIRSRTHHYPFRLVPPAPMLEYVQQLCAEEGITVEPGVLALVVRAGGGSPRDTLSLLDQLIAGSEGTTIDYERAVALLGYTHGALLDEVVDAIGARDAAGAFAAADRVVQTGQDPRRFVEDLLERLRDLIVVAASSPAAAAAVLRGVPEDELARMAVQAGAFGSAELSRVADLVNQTLTEMTGATSPRLHLELMLARVLVPSADDSERGAIARVEQLERRVAGGEFAAGRAAEPAAGRVAEPRTEAPAARAASVGVDASAAQRASEADRAPAPAPAPRAAPAPAPAVAAEAKPVGPVTLQQIRDAWPEVLQALQRTKRTAWMAALSAQVLEYRTDDDVLVLGFASPSEVQGLRSGTGTQNSAELLRTAIHDVLGVTVKFLPRVIGANAAPGPGADGPAGPPQASAPAADGGSDRVGAAAPQPADRPAQQAAAPKAQAPMSTAPSAPAGPVDSWATVAIPTDPAVDAAAEPDSRARVTTLVAEREVVPAAADDAPPLDDSAAPPEDLEPPFDPGPEPEVVVEASAPKSAPASATKAAPSKSRRAPSAPAATDGGIQRYGEAVVREVLGATFIEETEAPQARTGFGERG